MTKRLIIFISILCLGVSPVFAADFFEEWKNQITSGLQESSTVQAQGGTSYNGGGYYYSSPNVTINPISVRAPSISGGCGGISMDFGGFSHLDEESIVEFLKAMAAQAPGYFFELGLQVLCPSCTDLMNTLQQTAQIFNDLQFSSCQALQAVGNVTKKALANSTEYQNTFGESSSYSKALETANNALKEFNESVKNIIRCTSSYLGGDANLCPDVFLYGNYSILEIVFKDMKSTDSQLYGQLASLFGVSTSNELEMAGVFAPLIGDMLIHNKDKKDQGDKADDKYVDSSSTGKAAIIVPALYDASTSPNSLRNIISILTYGTDSAGLSPSSIDDLIEKYKKNNSFIGFSYDYQVEGSGSERKFTAPGYEPKTGTLNGKPLFIQVSEMLTSIGPKFYPDNRTGQPLTNEELALLGTFKTPVYKILNESSVDKAAVDEFVQNFKILGGPQLTYELMSEVHRALTTRIGVINAYLTAGGFNGDDTDEKFKSMLAQSTALQKAAYDLYVEKYAEFNNKMVEAKALKESFEKRKAILARIPTIGGSVFNAGM